MLEKPLLEYLGLFEAKADFRTGKHDNDKEPIFGRHHRGKTWSGSRSNPCFDTQILTRFAMQQLVSIFPDDRHGLNARSNTLDGRAHPPSG